MRVSDRHPHTRKPAHPHTRTILIAAFTVVLGVGTVIAQAPKGKGGPPPPPAAKVFVEEVRVDTLNEPKTFVGTVRPLRKSLVGSAAAGR
ncbi:MAG TPA: hypothetical protein VFB96_23495, partial [Pirellulaceae bacterium]|nr:hypothetical protein [Pirellulaceae bacterium]